MEDSLKVISILSVIFSFMFAPLGFILGLYAYLKIKKLKLNKEEKNWKTVALIGLIIGALFSLIYLIILIAFIGAISYFAAVDPAVITP